MKEPEAAEEANPPEVVPPPENEPQDEYDVPVGDDVPNSEQQRLLRTIHINLGHPSKPDFCRALRHGKCRPGAIEWVKKHLDALSEKQAKGLESVDLRPLPGVTGSIMWSVRIWCSWMTQRPQDKRWRG